ncbi:OLC1v1015834C1 [Oldenlandia corymbosa var. corymbosa]|uniref:OLC1v1015834C1 n=1 Tax=Oldenlandia corymbosa var. corymbosa TaxID=529605 RepID=A0AAV1E4M4_OLDCO|nr:OLC1v1015834C1 [Oldenlandia corymbosa var. corymbosa]
MVRQARNPRSICAVVPRIGTGIWRHLENGWDLRFAEVLHHRAWEKLGFGGGRAGFLEWCAYHCSRSCEWYVFPGKSFQMTMDWYHVAGRLAAGIQMNLAEAALAMLYHCLHEARHNPGSTLCGPVWLLHFLLYMYFPSLKPEGIFPVDNGKPLCLGKQKVDGGIMLVHLASHQYGAICCQQGTSSMISFTGGQKGKKTAAVAGGKAKPTVAKEVPTSSCRSNRITGQTRAKSEASIKDHTVTVHSSEEDSDSQESEKGSVAIGESSIAKKAMSETGGSKSKKRLKTASSSTQLNSAKKAPPSVAAPMARLEQTKAAAYVKVDGASSSSDIPLGVCLLQITEMF